MQAIGRGNTQGASDRCLDFSTRNPRIHKAFAADVRDMFSEKCKGYGHGTDLSEVMRAMMVFIQRHRVSIEGNYMTMVVNVMCLEGIARGCDPTYNLLEMARPCLVAHEKVGDAWMRTSWPLVVAA